ncbi:MAG TPA: hypothetical protein VFY98_06290 [Intrasporangium sp.]|nr:hypothetical protein [Intrasporangium sp.]
MLPREDVLLWQGEQIAPGLPAPIRLLLKVLRTDVVSKAKQQQQTKATTTDVARIGGAKVNARWMREFMAHDPRSARPRRLLTSVARHPAFGWDRAQRHTAEWLHHSERRPVVTVSTLVTLGW